MFFNSLGGQKKLNQKCIQYLLHQNVLNSVKTETLLTNSSSVKLLGLQYQLDMYFNAYVVERHCFLLGFSDYFSGTSKYPVT